MLTDGSICCYKSIQWQQLLLPFLQSAFQTLGKPDTINFCYHLFQWQQIVAAFATIQFNGSRYCYHCKNQPLAWGKLSTIHFCYHSFQWQQMVAAFATILLNGSRNCYHNGNGSKWQQNLLQLQQINCYHSIFLIWLPGFCNQATAFKTNYIDQYLEIDKWQQRQQILLPLS